MVNEMVKIRIDDYTYQVIDSDDVLLQSDVKDMVLKAVDFINGVDDDFLPCGKSDSLIAILEKVYGFQLQEYEETDVIVF